MKSTGAIFILLVAAFLSVEQASADAGNYQKYIIGERAMGMGGAYAAAVNDPMACYYNPGGMTFGSTSMISASKSLYSLDYRYIENGFVPQSAEAEDAKTLEHENDLSLPSTLALMFQFGPKLKGTETKRHALGLTMLVPYQDNYTLKGKWEGTGELRDQETYSLTESQRTIWTGLSYGARVHETLGLGLSAFLSNSKYQRRLDTSWLQDLGGLDRCGLSRCGYLSFSESVVDITVVSLIFRVGALMAPTESWRFGLTVTAPSIMLGDLFFMKTSGSLDQSRGTGYVPAGPDSPEAWDGYIEFFTDDYDLKVEGYEPMSVRAGVAYLWNESLVLDMDASVYLPVSYDRIVGDPVEDRLLEGDDPEASPEWFDYGVVRKIKRRPVVNVNLGLEWVWLRNWTLRAGGFTDFSSAPDVVYSDSPQLTKVHRVGATLSVGYQSEGYDVTLGVMGSMGRGEASVYNLTGARAEQGEVWQPAEYQERSIYIFIAGVQKALAKTVKSIWKKGQKEGDSEDAEEAPKKEQD